ncbi:MAG: hypothetical protein ACOX5A_06310 [Aminivibrio sp.]|jgi:hypothetical protein|nr:hypothetical protein [Synergistaceae bacterium]
MEQERNEVYTDQSAETDLPSAHEPEDTAGSGGEGYGGRVGLSLADSLPKEAADELCQIFSCTRESLDAILSGASGDPDRIIDLVKTLSPSFVAVKIRFDGRKRQDLGGALCFVARGNTGEILDESFWVSSRALPDTFDITAGWESVRSAITSIPGEPDRSLYSRMLKGAKSVLSPTAINKLFQSLAARDEILGALEKTFSSLVHYDLIFELHTETFNRVRLETGGITLEKKQPEAESKAEESTGAPLASLGTIQVVCRPVLDPVKGTAVSDLKKGDYIFVELEKTGGLASIINKIVERSGENTMFPVSSVERLPSGQSLVKLHISNGIEGVLRAGADLKLKTGNIWNKAGGRPGSDFPAGKIFAGVMAFLLLAAAFYLFMRR